MFAFRFIPLTLCCLLALTGAVRAQEAVRYHAKPLGSSVHISGAANVHDWTMDGNLIGGYFEIPAGVTLDESQATVAGAADGKINARAEVSIPVTSVKNGKWEGMDEVMQAAMNATDYPRIQYHLDQFTLKQPHAPGTPLQFDTTGQLSLNGVTNQITMTVTIENVDKTKLKITSSAVPIKMTDYKITPPVKLGLFRTDPEVKISFAWVVGLSTKSAEAH